MSALDNMKTRLEFEGGIKQENRMQDAKLKSLKKALIYSYQAATAILTDGREFRCLINPDRVIEEYNDKILSIPYDDICLNADKVGKTTEGIQHIGMKVGDTFTWKETNTNWIVYVEYLEEDAYFRARIRRCEDEVEINGKKYPAYMRRPNDQDLWHTKHNISWSEMGYEVVLYITRDENTEDFFHRYQKVRIKDRLWEVQFQDDITSDTMLIVYLKETFENQFETNDNTTQEYKDAEAAAQEAETQVQEDIEEIPAIRGERFVAYPYDELDFSVVNAGGGMWLLSNTKAKINHQTTQMVTITIVTGKGGSVDLIYRRNGEEDIVKTITIESF